MAGTAFQHMMQFGSLRHLTPEELADAVKIDPSQIKGLGPSIDSLLAMLMERKNKILSTYETESAQERASRAYRSEGSATVASMS